MTGGQPGVTRRCNRIVGIIINIVFEARGMLLSRRDALGALLVGGGFGVGVDQLPASEGVSREADDDFAAAVQALTAVADVVYPSAVTPTDEFVDEYVGGLPPERQRTVANVVQSLDAYARREFGDELSALSPDACDAVLRSLGVDRTVSDPSGSLPERVRYHVVNLLLYGLYTSPRGSRLVGIENPVGFPGGYESYQKSPSTNARQTN